MLENKYGEYEAIENKRILMERMNVNTQEEIDEIIKKDMEDFIEYTDSKMDESIGNYYEFYTNFNSWFDSFFDSYVDNLSKLAKLNEQFLSLLNIDDYLTGNEINIGDLTGENINNLKNNIDLSIDYSAEMEKAIAAGDLAGAQYLGLLREIKADINGITLGQGNYRTNEQVLQDAMEKFGMSYNGNQFIASTTKLNKSVDYALEIMKAVARGDMDDAYKYADLRTQKALENKITLGTGPYKSNTQIIQEALETYGKRYGLETISAINNLSYDARTLSGQNANTEKIEENIDTVREALSKAGYQTNSVIGQVATQIASSAKDTINAQQADALVQQLITSGISTKTAAVEKNTGYALGYLFGFDLSFDDLIKSVKEMDKHTVNAINSAFASGNFGGLSSSNKYNGTSDYGFGDAEYSSDNPYINLKENYTALANEALSWGKYELAAEYAALANQKVQSSDYKGSIVKVVYNEKTGKYEGVKKSDLDNATKGLKASNESNVKTLNRTLDSGNLYSSQIVDATQDLNKNLSDIKGNQKSQAQAIRNSESKTLEELKAQGKEVVDGTKMSVEEREQATSEGKYVDMGRYEAYNGKVGTLYLDPTKKPIIYESAEKDPGVVGSQAWLDEVRKEGWSESQIASTMAQISANGIERDAVKDVTSMKRNTAYAGQTITTGGYTVTYNENGYATKKTKNDASVGSEGQIIYTSRDGTQREVTKLVDTELIEGNIKTVSEAMDKMGYKIDTVGGVLASQIAAQIATSNKEAITKEQANALAQQMIATGISHDTASLINTSQIANQLMTNIGNSVDTAIDYLKSIDASTVSTINGSYGSGGGSGGGGSSSEDHSGRYVDGKYYSGMSAQGGANDDYSKENKNNSKNGKYDKYTDYSAAYEKATTKAEKDAIVAARDDKIKNEYGGHDPNPGWKSSKGYSSGLEKGPVTYTGLAMLHGTQNAPEYVLNNDQAYNLLYNLSMSRNAKMAEFEPKNVSNETQYIVQGDIILEGLDNPAEFWQEVTTAMGNRWNVTKNR